jgi:predicted nucleotide-binding protein
MDESTDLFVSELYEKAKNLTVRGREEIHRSAFPRKQIVSSDMLALTQGGRAAPHQIVMSDVAALNEPSAVADEFEAIARQAGTHLARRKRQTNGQRATTSHIFIGHGRSAAWRELKDFICERLKLPYDEFNRVSTAGIATTQRLNEMLTSAAFAFLVLTAEDETSDGKQQARMNVIHELGLFQGRLGFGRAIILLEDGCEEFSNIHGLGQIRFPKGNIRDSFEKLREVLEREGILVH